MPNNAAKLICLHVTEQRYHCHILAMTIDLDYITTRIWECTASAAVLSKTMSKRANRVQKWHLMPTFASISKAQASQVKKITCQTSQNTHTLATVQEDLRELDVTFNEERN